MNSHFAIFKIRKTDCILTNHNRMLPTERESASAMKLNVKLSKMSKNYTVKKFFFYLVHFH